MNCESGSRVALEAVVQQPVRRVLAVIPLVTVALGCSPTAGSIPGSRPADAPVAPSAVHIPPQPASEHSDDAPATEIVTELPDRTNPVIAAAALRPAKVRPGETVVFFIQARIAPTWHIYRAD